MYAVCQKGNGTKDIAGGDLNKHKDQRQQKHQKHAPLRLLLRHMEHMLMFAVSPFHRLEYYAQKGMGQVVEGTI